MTDFKGIINNIHDHLSKEEVKGVVASYIPELSKQSVNSLGIFLQHLNGDSFAAGDADIPFSIQSISKVLALSKAIAFEDNRIWQRVDVEPSGNPFNHLSLLELENGIPRNPLINSGALVVADILVTHLKNPKEDFLNYVRTIANDQTINYNKDVAASEKRTGYKNFAAANLLKSFSNLKNNVEDVLDFYFHQCSIDMTCTQLAKAFYLFANGGKCVNNVQQIPVSQAKRINAIMLTCGFYDEAGEFAFRVGLPGKSGVGGGIVAFLPNNFIISTWAPGLNPKGNSLLGMQALEQFTTQTKLSIF
ncbi:MULTISPECIES: glutaminase [unclassified Cellulophaga]|uniref:glutaminase n=1 Tax=unclassified Cellulophaga TaxID=2634405 RepID=UPI0026E1FDF0|nr:MULTISPECIES: glutaminase [unclassified Cellulophaga]MDO6491988.1 glutaminase [Cellulophaga sp. 2_MG-2023]MDO6495852.1 glutaminase [Cellulophaga sp. 3_MG-2023]